MLHLPPVHLRFRCVLGASCACARFHAGRPATSRRRSAAPAPPPPSPSTAVALALPRSALPPSIPRPPRRAPYPALPSSSGPRAPSITPSIRRLPSPPRRPPPSTFGPNDRSAHSKPSQVGSLPKPTQLQIVYSFHQQSNPFL